MRTHDHFTLVERSVLSLVHRHESRFGRHRLAEVLAGLPTGRVLEYGLEREPAFGAVRRGGLPAALRLLDGLQRRGHVDVDPTHGRYLVLELTATGRRALGLPARPGRHISTGFETPREQAAYDELVTRRNGLAAQSGCLGSQVARLSQLRDLVRARPLTPEALSRAAALPPASAERFAGLALEVLRAM